MSNQHSNQAIEQARTAGEAAALWWAQALQAPKHDNGDLFAMAFVDMLSEYAPKADKPNSALNKFTEQLAAKLDALLADPDKGYMPRSGITIGVDYDPDPMLYSTANEAGLDVGFNGWPWKTTMWVRPDEVTVRYGYQADLEVVWTRG